MRLSSPTATVERFSTRSYARNAVSSISMEGRLSTPLRTQGLTQHFHKGMSLMDFLGNQRDTIATIVRERQAAGKQSIRLKCPKSILQEFNVPERGFVMVHMKRYSFQARYDVSGSSFRVNLGVGFAPLLRGEAGKIKVVFKVLDGCFKMFYKEEEEALYQPQISRPDYGRGFYFCPVCSRGFYNADKCPSCGT